MEHMLRGLALSKPSTAMDAKVMARRGSKLPVMIWVSGLAAAAAVIVAVLFADMQETPVAPAQQVLASNNIAAPEGTLPPPPREGLVPLRVEQVIHVISDEVKPAAAGQSPVRELRCQNVQKVVWVDKTNGVHVETVGQPREEVILIKTQVE